MHFTGGAPSPLGALEVMVRRGLIWWLRGSIGEKAIAAIREEAGRLYADALRAWEVVAPRPDNEGRVRHTQHRRSAYGPVGQESDDIERPSGVYPTMPGAMPWGKAAG